MNVFELGWNKKCERVRSKCPLLLASVITGLLDAEKLGYMLYLTGFSWMKNKPTTEILKIQYIHNTLSRHTCAFFPNAIQTSEKRISQPFFSYLHIIFVFVQLRLYFSFGIEYIILYNFVYIKKNRRKSYEKRVYGVFTEFSSNSRDFH